MSKLSEEEIIRNVKRIIEYKVISNYINDNDSRAIQGLLDLYNKEKKKNKRYEKYLRNKDIEHEKVLEYIETEIETDYIPKSKVREKIEELEKEIENINNKNDGYWEDTSIILDEQKQVLEELLQEGDDK